MQLRYMRVPALITEAGGMLAGLSHQPGIPFSIPGLGAGHLCIPGTPASVDPEWNRSPGPVTHDHFFDAEHHH